MWPQVEPFWPRSQQVPATQNLTSSSSTLSQQEHTTSWTGNAVQEGGEQEMTVIRKRSAGSTHLFEADFNLFLKLQWGSRLVKRAVKHDLLNTGQHGSVPKRTAMDPIMLTQLTSDLCRFMKHNLTRFDNDASACYDRIIVALGMLAARRFGIPEDAIKTHADSLKFMQYAVKTIYGILEDNYQ